MHQKFVKKIGRLLNKHGLEVHDYSFVTQLEDRVRKMREEADDPNELEFAIDFDYDGVVSKVVVYGEIVEDWVTLNGEEVLRHPPHYEYMEIYFSNGNPPVQEPIDYTESL